MVCVRSQLHGGLGWRSPLWLVRRLACAAGCWFGAGHHLGAVSDPVTTLTHYGSSHFEHSAVVLGSVEAPALGVMWVGLPSTASQRVTPSCGTAETCSSCPSTFTWSMLLAVAPLAHDGVSGLEICAQWFHSITLVVSHWSCCVGRRVGGKVSVLLSGAAAEPGVQQQQQLTGAAADPGVGGICATAAPIHGAAVCLMWLCFSIPCMVVLGLKWLQCSMAQQCESINSS